jgi:hypothetical protein
VEAGPHGLCDDLDMGGIAMLRTGLAVIACLMLAGCWMSEQRFFGPGDWAHLDFNGRYVSQNADGDTTARVTFATRPDGLIDGTGVNAEDGSTEESTMGLVPIRGGSGEYFLVVDRTDEDEEGDIYFIARLIEGPGLELYWPDCGGTTAVAGMAVESSSFTETETCTFSSREALMTAALEAETFLAARHVVAVAPMGKLVPLSELDDE